MASCFFDAISRKGIRENDAFDWEKDAADGSLTTTTASSTQGNYNPTPQGLRPDIAVTNISELPRTNEPALNDDSLKNDNARQLDKRRWSFAETGMGRGDGESILGGDIKSPDAVAPLAKKDFIEGLIEGQRPQLKDSKVTIISSICYHVILRIHSPCKVRIIENVLGSDTRNSITAIPRKILFEINRLS